MLALLGLATVLLLLALIVSRRVTPLVALIVVPIAAALAGGFGLETGQFVMAGLQAIAPVVAMFVFAILFFGDHDRRRPASTRSSTASCARSAPGPRGSCRARRCSRCSSTSTARAR